MTVTRRDFLKATAAIAAALGVEVTGLPGLRKALGLEAADGGAPVVWLQAQTCSGCSVSLLNSIFTTTIDDLLLNKLDLEFHPTVMAAAGNLAVSAAEKAYRRGDYVLVVEGAIPTGAGGKYCELWPGLSALKGINRFASRAKFIVGVGTCACYGGMAGGAPNPTQAKGLDASYGSKRVVKIPGCPSHPDWIVGAIAYILANGTAPPLDGVGRPTMFFSNTVHSLCPYRELEEVSNLGQIGCLEELGCKGPGCRADCPIRRWNSGAAGQPGMNWCIGAGAPCYGCTEPSFPDAMSPFYRFGGDD